MPQRQVSNSEIVADGGFDPTRPGVNLGVGQKEGLDKNKIIALEKRPK